MRVLVCDDDASVREFLTAMFEVDGWEAAAVDSGEACLDAIDSGPPPDVVVLDQVMPGLHGTQVADRLREDGYRRPIILCSAHVGREFHDEIRRLDLIKVNKIDMQAVIRIAGAAVRDHEQPVRAHRQQWPD